MSQVEKGKKHTQQQHLDLVAKRQLISFQLILNLLVPLLPLLIFRTHSTTHLGGVCDGGPLYDSGTDG